MTLYINYFCKAFCFFFKIEEYIHFLIAQYYLVYLYI